MSSPSPYGYLAEFDQPDLLVAAAHLAYEQGYRKMDAFTPFPIEGLDEALGEKKNWLPLIVFCENYFSCWISSGALRCMASIVQPRLQR